MRKQGCIARHIVQALLLAFASVQFAIAQPPAPVAGITSEFEKVKLKADELLKAQKWQGAIESYEDFINAHKDASKWVYEAIAQMARIMKQAQADEAGIQNELRKLVKADLSMVVKVLKLNGGGLNKHRAFELVNGLLEMELADDIAVKLLLCKAHITHT